MYPVAAVGIYTAVVTASNSLGLVTATTTVVVEKAVAGLHAANDSPTTLGRPTALTATVTAGTHVLYTLGRLSTFTYPW